MSRPQALSVSTPSCSLFLFSFFEVQPERANCSNKFSLEEEMAAVATVDDSPSPVLSDKQQALFAGFHFRNQIEPQAGGDVPPTPLVNPALDRLQSTMTRAELPLVDAPSA